MDTDREQVMISALQHYVFCRRQCALIHVEQMWTENALTAQGRILHEHVDSQERETRRDVRLATAVRLASRELGLIGVADMLEFHRVPQPMDEQGRLVAVPLPGRKGFWRPFLVEYKRGKPKVHREDEVQLCAQAMCLEEMLKVSIPGGALFYGQSRRRTDVAFDEGLRTLTKSVAEGVHRLISEGVTPAAEYSKACEACSLKELCCPEVLGKHRSAQAWVEREMKEVLR